MFTRPRSNDFFTFILSPPELKLWSQISILNSHQHHPYIVHCNVFQLINAFFTKPKGTTRKKEWELKFLTIFSPFCCELAAQKEKKMFYFLLIVVLNSFFFIIEFSFWSFSSAPRIIAQLKSIKRLEKTNRSFIQRRKKKCRESSSSLLVSRAWYERQ